jgi:hypothetical protein
MSPVLLTILIAGIVFAGFLLLAAIAWGIRTRRGEENSIPAPDRKKNVWESSAAPDESGEIPDWLQPAAPKAGESGGRQKDTPEWLRGMTAEAREFDSPFGSTPVGTEKISPVLDMFRGAFPQVSTLVSLGKLVKQIQAEEGSPETPEVRLTALTTAVKQLLEKNPEDEFLLRIRDALQSAGPAGDAVGGESVKVVQVAGRNVVRVGEDEYDSVSEIPDPELRDQVRSILAALGTQEKGGRESEFPEGKSSSG